jgi:hypothetical protein
MKYYLYFGRTLSIHHDILASTNAKLTSCMATNQIKDDIRCGIFNMLMRAATSNRSRDSGETLQRVGNLDCPITYFHFKG